MNRNILLILAISTIMTIGVIGWSLQTNKPTSPPSANFAAQENNEGDVEVKITPKVLLPGKSPVFDIELNTHSVTLSYDLTQLSILTDERQTDYGNSTWEGTPPGGHHRSGTLTFSKPMSPKAQKVILTLKDISGISSRAFTWEVKS